MIFGRSENLDLSLSSLYFFVLVLLSVSSRTGLNSGSCFCSPWNVPGCVASNWRVTRNMPSCTYFAKYSRSVLSKLPKVNPMLIVAFGSSPKWSASSTRDLVAGSKNSASAFRKFDFPAPFRPTNAVSSPMDNSVASLIDL